MEELLLTDECETISGTVEKITFRNEANGYTVSSVKTEKETIKLKQLKLKQNSKKTFHTKGFFTKQNKLYILYCNCN